MLPLMKVLSSHLCHGGRDLQNKNKPYQGFLKKIIGYLLTLSCGMELKQPLLKGGLGDFIANTGRSLPMLTGNVVALVAGGVICLIVSYMTSEQASSQYCQHICIVTIFIYNMRKIFATFYQGIEKNKEWDKTRDIDNPLTPWTMLYQVDLNLPPPKTHHERPSVEMSVHL